MAVVVRSGDTPEAERRQLRRHPPEILITTPESLNILLTQGSAASLFRGLKLVILDEIHSVLDSKRGTSLWLALERLVALAGEFQRVGLSATVNPPDLAARVLGGFNADDTPRRVTVINSTKAKAYDVRVVVPELQLDAAETGKVFWESLALELRRRVRNRNSTLIFTNSRRACEKLARLINENQEEIVAYSHHGSLSREIRQDVEAKLKAGDLRALVATNSLELGIDIGDLDEVVLAQTPRTAASAIQKVGRAGHAVGEVSRARLYPSHGLDLIEAAVITRCIRDQAVEPLAVPEGPLDVLAQAVLSILCAEPATADEVYQLVRRAWPYRHLDRRAFDLVIDMLAGRYAGSRISELKPRIEVDPTTAVWSAKAAIPFLLFSSGGMIPDRGYFAMRDLRTGTTLGELDEEFVWERTLGDRFALGAQVWKIAAITEQAVQVEPVASPPHTIPFWKAEDQDRGWFLAERIGLFLQEADQALAGTPADIAAWTSGLSRDGFSEEAATRVASTLVRERQAVGVLPHRWRIVIERVAPEVPGSESPGDAEQYVVHTFWGARLNRPWAFALAQAWEDRFGYALEAYPGDDQVLILLPPESDLEEALSLVTATNLEALLRRRLEATGYFGARFREAAGRALLLPRPGFAKRVPLWKSRLKSKRLLEAVTGFPEFPILIEAWRQCVQDEFELGALQARLDEWSTGSIQTVRCRTSHPSPFTEGLLWRQINKRMYEGDEPPARRPSGLDAPLWDQLVGVERPRLPQGLVTDWEARWGRTAPGYAPESPADLADLLEVRVALSTFEWDLLLDAVVRDSDRPRTDWEVSVPVVSEEGRVGVSRMAALWNEPEPLWLRWLEGRGPVGLAEMARFWGQRSEAVEAWARRMTDSGELVMGSLLEGTEERQVCLARTWEQLVRRQRLANRNAVSVRPAEDLPRFLADWQGLLCPRSDVLQKRVGQLLGLPLPAGLWEEAVLPSRVSPYRSADLDRLFVEEGLRWFGAGPNRVVLGFPEDRADFLADSPAVEDCATVDRLFGLPNESPSEASFPALADRSRLGTGTLTEMLWALAWKGLVSTTTFAPLRQGLRAGFRYESGTDPGRIPVRGFQRWASTRSLAGTWCRWDSEPSAPTRPRTPTTVEQMEGAKRRARVVLDRYGIVFRSLLLHESPRFQWTSLFPALRLMELSGEIVGGQFWEGVPGLQFASPEVLRRLEFWDDDPGDRETALWVQHAQDPSSLCGLGIEAAGLLPRRTAGTWLWWRGRSLMATLSAGGKKLELSGQLETDALNWLLRRTATLLLPDGRTHWTLETIDGQSAADHPLATSLSRAGFHVHGDKLLLWKVP